VRVDDRIENLVGDIAGERDQIFGFLRRQQPVHAHRDPPV